MFLIDRRYVRYFDWLSLSLIIVLSCIGSIFIFSTTYKPSIPFSIFFKKQLLGILSGIVIYFTFCFFDYRSLCRWGYFIFFAIIGLLAFTMVKGSIGMGAQRWINIGLFKFQPAELAKLFLPAFLSYYFLTQQDIPSYTTKDFLPPILIIMVTFLLVLKQPDLGTALIILFSGFILLWWAGLSKKVIISGLLCTIITAPITWHFLKPYQQQRVLVFLGCGSAHKERYQIEQSKIAIGSGGLFGKGLLHGTQNRLMFLPESRTDFIFSVLCEEWGFIGAFALLILFLLLFVRLLSIVATLPEVTTQLLAIGLIIHIIFSTLINIGMVLGLLPIVGIPLPFISYGVSNLWITFASLGWFNGIAIARYYTGKY